MKTTDIREDDLGQRYQSMGNEELLDRAASGTLTELAQQVADEEIKKRRGDRHAPAGDISFAASSVLPKRKIPWWFLLALLALLQVGYSIVKNWKLN